MVALLTSPILERVRRQRGARRLSADSKVIVLTATGTGGGALRIANSQFLLRKLPAAGRGAIPIPIPVVHGLLDQGKETAEFVRVKEPGLVQSV